MFCLIMTLLLIWVILIVNLDLKKRVRELKAAVAHKSFITIRRESGRDMIRCVVCEALAPHHLPDCDYERQDMIRARADIGRFS